jgi:hypothetical protein
MKKEQFLEKLHLIPQKYEDFGTITYQMKMDIFNEFNGKNLNCIEIGCYKGYTTDMLSSIFTNVLALDNNDECLSYAKKNNANNPNVSFEKVDLYSPHEWDKIFQNYQDKFEVALVDASHKYEHCKSDIINAIKLGCKYIILDDVGVYDGIKQATSEIATEYSSRIKKIREIGIDWKHYKLPLLNLPVFNFRISEINYGLSTYEFTWILRDKTDIELNGGQVHKHMFDPLNTNIQIIRNYINIVDGHYTNKLKSSNSELIREVFSEGMGVYAANNNSRKPPHKFTPFPIHRFSSREIQNMIDDQENFSLADTNFEGTIIELL